MSGCFRVVYRRCWYRDVPILSSVRNGSIERYLEIAAL